MNVALRKSINFITNSIRQKNPLVCLNVTRSLFNNTYTGIHKYVFVKSKYKDQLSEEKIESLKKEVKRQIDSKTTLDPKSLVTLIYVLESKDSDLIISAISTFMNQNQDQLKKKLVSSMLIRYLIYYDMSDQMNKLINDKKFNGLFESQAFKLLAMNKLAIDKNYEKCLEIFESNLSSYNVKNIRPNGLIKMFDQAIPKNHLQVVFEVLFYMNSRKSFDKMLTYLDITKKYESPLYNRSIAACFLLSLKQKEIDTAFNILKEHGNAMETRNPTLFNNLLAIGHCYRNDIEKAKDCLTRILALNPTQKDKFNGKIFPFTVKQFSKLLNEGIWPESLNKEEYKQFLKRIEDEDRISCYDIIEYCTESPKKPNSDVF